jgi:hypothetical protein
MQIAPSTEIYYLCSILHIKITTAEYGGMTIADADCLQTLASRIAHLAKGDATHD